MMPSFRAARFPLDDKGCPVPGLDDGTSLKFFGGDNIACVEVVIFDVHIVILS